MVDQRFADAVTGALAEQGWTVEELGGAQLVTTGVGSLPHLILRITTPTESPAVLDMCCPFVREPTDDGVLLALGANAAIAQDGALLSSYVAADGTGYLGGFARMPVPMGFWSVEAVRPLISIGGRSLAVLRARIPGLNDWCDSQGVALGKEVFPDVRSGSPPGTVDASS